MVHDSDLEHTNHAGRAHDRRRNHHDGNERSRSAVNQEFYIDSEAVDPSAIAGNVVTITRADIGTTAKAHATGAQVNVLKYKSLKNFCKQVMQAAVADIMSRATYPTGATQDAAIAAANAVKASAVAGSVQ